MAYILLLLLSATLCAVTVFVVRQAHQQYKNMRQRRENERISYKYATSLRLLVFFENKSMYIVTVIIS